MFRVGGACKRCQMITLEHGSGQVTMEPLRSFAQMKNQNFSFRIHTSLSSVARKYRNTVLYIELLRQSIHGDYWTDSLEHCELLFSKKLGRV